MSQSYTIIEDYAHRNIEGTYSEGSKLTRRFGSCKLVPAILRRFSMRTGKHLLEMMSSATTVDWGNVSASATAVIAFPEQRSKKMTYIQQTVSYPYACILLGVIL